MVMSAIYLITFIAIQIVCTIVHVHVYTFATVIIAILAPHKYLFISYELVAIRKGKYNVFTK